MIAHPGSHTATRSPRSRTDAEQPHEPGIGMSAPSPALLPDDRLLAPLDAALAWLAAGAWPVLLYPAGWRLRDRRGGLLRDKKGRVIPPMTGKEPIGRGWGRTRPTPEGLGEVARRYPDAGLGLKLGLDAGLIDLDVDDPERARPILERMFPGGLPRTAGFRSNRGLHLLFRYDPRLARHGRSVIENDDKGIVTAYPGLELRIGTIDPRCPLQVQSVIPPTPRS